MSGQLPLDLPTRTALGREMYLVSPANADAMAMIDDWAGWPGGKLVLTGPEGAGKTHLAHVWAAAAGGEVRAVAEIDPADPPRRLAVDNADQVAGDPAAEEALFHIHNAVLAREGRLLLTARTAPRDWGVGLADLLSRLSAAGVARLGAPDDALMAGLLAKLFADRHIRPHAGLIDWMVPRIERSFAAAAAAVARLDAAALSEGKSVGIRLATRTLEF